MRLIMIFEILINWWYYLYLVCLKQFLRVWKIENTILWDSRIKMDHSMPARKSELMSISIFTASVINIVKLARSVIFWPLTQPKNTIPRWYTGRKWRIPMASNRKRSRGRIKAYDMGQGEGPIVPLQWCTGRE